MIPLIPAIRVSSWGTLLLLLSTVVAACGSDGTGPDSRVATVAVSAPSSSVQSGGTMQLSADAKNSSGVTVEGKTFAWSSSSDAVASVNSAGLVTGNAEGSVTVTATESGSGQAGSVTLTVTPAPVAALTIEPASVSVQVGGTKQLSAATKDASGNTLAGRTVTWSSSNTEVATVGASGLVTAKAAGSATVTATSEGVSAGAKVSVEAVPAGKFERVFAGGAYTCGVDPSGKALCWGGGKWGRLGNGTVTWQQSKPTRVAGDLTWSSVVAEYQTTCGVASSGRAYCWGWGTHGQLGNGTTEDSVSAPVVVVSVGQAWADVDPGVVHTCGRTTSFDAYCWGVNGLLGHGDTSESQHLAVPVPKLVAGGHKWLDISAGGSHTCGVTVGDGEAYCWGNGKAGKLGTGTTLGTATPQRVHGEHSWFQITAATYHTCAVTVAGEGYCWGDGQYGMLGNGGTNATAVPTPVWPGKVWDSIRAASQHTCGVTTEGEGYCWGRGTRGKLGDGDTSDHVQLRPVLVTGGHRWRSIWPGSGHTCGVTRSDEAYCWGNGSLGALGTGETGFVTGTPVRVRR